MNKLIFIFNNGYYRKQRYQDEYLGMLSYIFDDGSYWVEAVRQELLDSEGRGLFGNKSRVKIKGDIVTIQPLYAECPEDYAIQIDRNVLLRLINEWNELTEKRTKEIVFTRHDDGSITISGNDESVEPK